MPFPRSFYASAGCVLLLSCGCPALMAQQAPAQTPTQTPAQQTVGRIDIASTTEKIRVAGAVTLDGSNTLLGNGSTVTAGTNTLPIHLTRGGQLDLCATTELHLSEQNNAPDPNGPAADPNNPAADPNNPLMLALDRGAIEAHYAVGKNSDVVLTPDLRILLSGPGKADVRIRVNDQGDTCVDNRGEDAPYVTVSEQMGTGVYRVQPNQHVLFEHGSVRDVVDHETQPCGCPARPAAAISVASSGKSASAERAVKPDEAVAAGTAPIEAQPVGGPSSTPADTTFPLAESEGLAPAPLPAKPVTLPGEVQSEVTTTLSYNAPKQAVPTGAPNGMATPESAATTATAPAPGFGTTVNLSPVVIAQAPAVEVPQPAQPKSGFFHKIGRLLARIFG